MKKLTLKQIEIIFDRRLEEQQKLRARLVRHKKILQKIVEALDIKI